MKSLQPLCSNKTKLEEEAKAPLSVCYYFLLWGLLICFSGKPRGMADWNSHTEESYPAMTAGKANGLWNSITCKTCSKEVATSTITHSQTNNTVCLRQGKENGLSFGLETSDYYTDRNGTSPVIFRVAQKYSGFLIFKNVVILIYCHVLVKACSHRILSVHQHSFSSDLKWIHI